MPRFTDTACRDAVGPFVKGEMAYTSADDRLWIYNGTAWEAVSAKIGANLTLNANFTQPAANQNGLVPMRMTSPYGGITSTTDGVFVVPVAGLYAVQLIYSCQDIPSQITAVSASIAVGAFGTIKARGTALVLRGDGLSTATSVTGVSAVVQVPANGQIRSSIVTNVTNSVVMAAGTVGSIEFVGRG